MSVIEHGTAEKPIASVAEIAYCNIICGKSPEHNFRSEAVMKSEICIYDFRYIEYKRSQNAGNKAGVIAGGIFEIQSFYIKKSGNKRT